MAALLLILLITMAGYAWLFGPLLDFGTGLLRAVWLLWLPVLLAIWLLANHDS
jgi:hypothetical protein